jgi:hypothetical protein
VDRGASRASVLCLFEAHTGDEARQVESGRSFDEIAAEAAHEEDEP